MEASKSKDRPIQSWLSYKRWNVLETCLDNRHFWNTTLSIRDLALRKKTDLGRQEVLWTILLQSYCWNISSQPNIYKRTIKLQVHCKVQDNIICRFYKRIVASNRVLIYGRSIHPGIKERSDSNLREFWTAIKAKKLLHPCQNLLWHNLTTPSLINNPRKRGMPIMPELLCCLIQSKIQGKRLL